MSEWISVKTRLPKQGQDVLVNLVDEFGDSFLDVDSIEKHGGKVIACSWTTRNPRRNSPPDPTPTHWMELPPGPGK